MEFVLGLPALVKILVSLGLILVVNRMRLGLPLSVLIGTVVLALWSGHSVRSIVDVSFLRAVSPDNLFLMLVILLVIWLSSTMAESGTMRALVAAVRSRTNRQVSMAMLPAIIGLLPMPGGALFSAPMVADCDDTGILPATTKTVINYWFRHIWEYSWPLYPGVLLAVDLAGIRVWQLPVVQIPLTLAALGIGYLFLLRHVPNDDTAAWDATERVNREENRESIGTILRLMQPIIVVIGVFVVVSVLFPAVSRFNKYLPMATGLVSALVALQLTRPLDGKTWRGILLSKRAYGLVILVTLVRIYGAFIEAPLPDGVLLIEQVRGELTALGVPITLLVMFLPFICGMVTGITVGFVGASFPIVMSLLDPSVGGVAAIAPVMLAYASGFMGVMVSPVHVCFVVSAKHFETGLPENLRRLSGPVVSMLVLALAYYGFLKSF